MSSSFNYLSTWYTRLISSKGISSEFKYIASILVYSIDQAFKEHKLTDTFNFKTVFFLIFLITSFLNIELADLLLTCHQVLIASQLGIRA